jgi:transketolase
MPDPPKAYGARGGVTYGDVAQAADALFRARERPTVEKIRAKIGGGSPNTIGPLLDQWWATAAERLEAGPAAFHRLPESVAHICEALWLQALEEGRKHAAREQQVAGRKLATDQQQVELRSHVLTLREGELESRLRDRERDKAALEQQLKVLAPLLRQEQATREAQARRIADLEAQLEAHRHRLATVITRAVAKNRAMNTSKPASRSRKRPASRTPISAKKRRQSKRAKPRR